MYVSIKLVLPDFYVLLFVQVGLSVLSAQLSIVFAGTRVWRYADGVIAEAIFRTIRCSVPSLGNTNL